MKLYFSPGACSLSCRININEMGLACEFEKVDLKTKKTESAADYFKIAPKGAVPALVMDNGQLLTEGAAILQYLADTHKKTDILPAIGDLNRYHVIEWLNFVGTEMHKNSSAMFNAQIPQMMKDEVLKPILVKKLDIVNSQLANNKFLTGETYSLPDGYLFTILRWIMSFKMDLAQWEHVYRFYNEIKSRPSVVKSLQEEGL